MVMHQAKTNPSPWDQKELNPAFQFSDRRHRLAHALCLSNEMLMAAQAGDWVRVSTLDEERSLLLTDDVFEVEAAESPLVAQAINALVQVNHEITRLAADLRNTLQTEFSTSLLQHQASKNYAAVATAF